MRAFGSFVTLVAFSLTAGLSSGWAADQSLPLKASPRALASPGRFWGELEFLYWQTKGDALPALMTSGATGALGAPGTTVLFGDSSVNQDWRPGGRIRAGYWFDDFHITGLEAHFFGLASTSTNFNASSAGVPLLARPFFNADPAVNSPDALNVAFLAGGPGQVSVNESTRLFGAGAAYQRQLCARCFAGSVTAMVGYRYLKLSDDLRIANSTNSINPLLPLGTFAVLDQFDTRNQFNGLDLGLTGFIPHGAWRIDWLAKVALGTTSTNLNINGSSSFTPLGGPTTVLAGGLLALPTNIGSHSDSRFSTVSEFNAKLGYQFTPQWRAFVGYNVLYWTGVVRPGGAIDTTVNSSQLAPAVLVGPARPAVQFNSTDFWAQGVSVGIAFNY